MRNITENISRLEAMREQEKGLDSSCPDMETIPLYESISDLTRDILITLVSSYSSGTIAGFIGSCKYTQIDNAISKTLLFLYHATSEQIHDLQVNAESVKGLVCACYRDDLKPIQYTREEIREAEQYIADVYHCSGEWGIKQTPLEMKLGLTMWGLEKNPGDYSPPVSMFKQCANYWNWLCDKYPN